MSKLKKIVIVAICVGLMLNLSSCIVFVKHDNGKHKGWYKNRNNPHHPNSTKPENSKKNKNNNGR